MSTASGNTRYRPQWLIRLFITAVPELRRTKNAVALSKLLILVIE